MNSVSKTTTPSISGETSHYNIDYDKMSEYVIDISKIDKSISLGDLKEINIRLQTLEKSLSSLEDDFTKLVSFVQNISSSNNNK